MGHVKSTGDGQMWLKPSPVLFKLKLLNTRKGRAIDKGRVWHSDLSPVLFYYLWRKSLEGRVKKERVYCAITTCPPSFSIIHGEIFRRTGEKEWVAAHSVNKSFPDLLTDGLYDGIANSK